MSGRRRLHTARATGATTLQASAMASWATYALAVLGVYWLGVFWKRWVLHARTHQFVLEQRRKAGIPDTDKRPLAIAAADAAQRRQRAFEEQLRQSEDVFGPAQPVPHIPVRDRAPLHTVPKPEPLARQRTITQREPRKRERTDSDAGHTKRNRTEAVSNSYEPSHCEARPSRKRHAETQSDAQSDAPTRKMRRKIPHEDDEVSDESMSDVSEESQPDEEDEIESMDEEDELVPGPEHGKKRAADTSQDHGPGDEWRDANGLRWRIGDDGVPRRLVPLVEMRPKYRMPKDATHSDTKAKVPSYTDKFLSQEEYEEAKRKKQLAWQHELALAKNSAANSPLAGISDDNVEDSLASLVSRRTKIAPRRSVNNLLHSEGMRTPQQLVRSRASSVAGDDSFGASMSERSGDDSRSFSSSISSKLPDSLSASTSRRMPLTRSPAHAALRAPRFARVQVASSPLSPARGALDQAAKRKREEQLMAQIRANRSESASSSSAPKNAPPASSTGSGAAPQSGAAPAAPRP